MNLRQKVKELGGEVQPIGINWQWSIGFSEENAKEFVAWLSENDYEHRGAYPPDHTSDTWNVRFRPFV